VNSVSTLPIKSLISASIGNVLEWYEYTLYAYFATVISDLFFPTQNSSTSMMLTFATFAVGLAARPVGGVIFGHIGDRYSRKKMLTITLLLMSIPTLCIGLLPTYAVIGISAPLLLIFLRIIQGIALGGEFGASCVYLFESVPQNKRGFFSSFALTGVGMGLILSACTVLIIETFISRETIYAFAWRLPFFISVIGAFIGFYMRRTLLETGDFSMAQKENILIRFPFLELFKNHKRTLLRFFSIFLTTQTGFFIVFIFGKTMMINFLNYTTQTAGKFNLLTVISYTFSTFVFGYLSDKINKRTIILAGTLGIFLVAIPFIDALKGGIPSFILGTSLLMGAFMGMTEGTLNSVVAESFPTNIRATGVAFCWNFTSVSFGSIAPIISLWIMEKTQNINIVGYYLMAMCAATLLVTSFHKKRF
jgi:MHS family proline/betaine transporter-like MFS transporter